MKVYHGTEPIAAENILQQGFKLGEERHGRVRGNGLYVSCEMATSVYWGEICIECELAPSIRLLRYEDYDKKIISYLKKEFGKEILSFNFHRAIPHNKHLKKHELFALVNYFFKERWKLFRRGKYDKELNLNRLAEQLRRHKIDGILNNTKMYWDDDEIMVLNPSLVKPLRFFSLSYRWKDNDTPQVTTKKLLSENEVHQAAEKERAEYKRLGMTL